MSEPHELFFILLTILLFCGILSCVFVVMQQVFLLIYILRFCGVAILIISTNLKCKYKKSVLWRYNDSNFQIYGVWHKSIDNLKVAKCHFEIKMTTIYSQLHSPKISCIQSVYNLTFYNRKWTFTIPKSHIEHKRNGLWGYVIIYL